MKTRYQETKPLNPNKCVVSFSVDPHQANLQSHFLSFNFPLCFNPTRTFLGVLTTIFPFLHMFLGLNPNSFLMSRPYAVSMLLQGTAPKSPLLFLAKLFSDPSLMLHLDDFHFSTVQSCNAFTKQLVTPCPASFCLASPYLPYESP